VKAINIYKIKSPWKKGDDQISIDNCLHLCLQLSANLAIYMNPFLPFTAKKLCRMMKVVDRMLEWENGGSLKLLKQGYPLNPPELLFRKVEDEEIMLQKEKLEAGSKKVAVDSTQLTVDGTQSAIANTQSAQISDLKSQIVFEDFDKIDIRVATIIAAEKVAKADKLLKLTIDLGFETRTVVSGIALHYSPEEIIGKQVSVIANLAPRKMKGIESNGMILMAENADGKLIFINADSGAMNGSPVK
jgi:methionyl-tRNA synthetase